MKKLLHIITLSLAILSISYAEMNCYVFTDKDERAECERMNIRESMSLSQTTKKKDKNWFLGIDGGIGLLIPTKMIFLPKEELGITKGISYIAGANFGWQKYGKGRVGSRYTIGLQYAWGDYLERDTQIKKSMESFILYFTMELMIDFIKRENKRFGMFLGVTEQAVGSILRDIDYRNGGGGVFISLETGLYINLTRHILDVHIGFPVFMLGFNRVTMPLFPILGYKYLF